MIDRTKKRGKRGGPDFRRLDGFCRPVGMVRLWEGDHVPCVAPLDTFTAGQMAFDRQVCAAGLKRFIRQVWDGEEAEAVCGHLLVEEAAEGVRFKMGLNVAWPGLN